MKLKQKKTKIYLRQKINYDIYKGQILIADQNKAMSNNEYLDPVLDSHSVIVVLYYDRSLYSAKVCILI